MKNLLKKNNFLLGVLFFLLFTKGSLGAYLIRDAETEDYIKLILDEILVVAEIPPKSISLYLLKDDNINAFVAPGSGVFVYTGLIQSSENYEVVQAVLAHEIGHLKAMHVLRFNSNLDKALLEALFYSVSAALLAIGGGPAAAAIVGLAAGSNVAERSMLKYSRAQEMEADYYSAKFLKSLNSSGEGSFRVFEKFEKMEAKIIDFQKGDEYRTTHPFSKDRLSYMKSQFVSLPYKPVFNQTLEEKHLFITAKLAGYFGNMQNIYSSEFRSHPDANAYFKVFEAFRKDELETAENGIKDLLKKHNLNPYFYEALAEIYFKKGDFASSISSYQKAISIKPKNFNFLFGMAESQFANKNFSLAIKFMNEAFTLEPYNPLVPYKLANYHSAKSEIYPAKIYFLESEILRQNYSKAKFLLRNLNEDLKSNNIKLNDFYSKKISDISDVLSKK